MRTWGVPGPWGLASAACAAFAACPPACGQGAVRVSLGEGGAQSNGHSWQAWLSGDGRFVAFESLATNLVGDDSNGTQDIFVRDRLRGITTRVSVASDGTEGDGLSSRPAISFNGRYVAFQSHAANLVPGDTNGEQDVFVHDLWLGETTRVSVDSSGGQANDRSIHPHISADGRFVVMHSEASNLVPGDTNAQWDVYVHDRLTGEITRDSVRTDGGEGNDWSEHATISGRGQVVAYHSDADDLIDGDTNGVEDVFVFDRATRVTTRISEPPGGGTPDGLSAFPNISQCGGFVAFESKASNLVPGDTNGLRDIFVCDLSDLSIVRVSVSSGGAQTDAESFTCSISRGGRYVAFFSNATTLVPGDDAGYADAFVHDLATGETARVSLGMGGQEATGISTYTTISANGRYVAFQSSASNLVPGDTNSVFDVFVYDRGAPSLFSFGP